MLITDYGDVTQGFDPGVLSIDTYKEDNLRVTRTGVSRAKSDDELLLEFHITVAEEKDITTFKDVHRLTNFSKEAYRAAFEKAGLAAEFIDGD